MKNLTMVHGDDNSALLLEGVRVAEVSTFRNVRFTLADTDTLVKKAINYHVKFKDDEWFSTNPRCIKTELNGLSVLLEKYSDNGMNIDDVRTVAKSIYKPLTKGLGITIYTEDYYLLEVIGDYIRVHSDNEPHLCTPSTDDHFILNEDGSRYECIKIK